MPLSPGTRLGVYEIVAPLGAGGMGDVYRARDTRLDRTVAIKTLPDALAADPQFRERFEREARAISSLDHPHICALYDVGEARIPSHQPSSSHQPSAISHDVVRFLVMQYLEGPTLADRLSKGPLPLDETLRTAIQIADALAFAHRAGIVHRDLKPGNVMLTKSGAKLLDFGLAKTSTPAVTTSNVSMLATTPPAMTAQGTILGTFQYMAPEQIEGRDADARSDIFAFGAVLYEMVAGKKAFEGKTHASLMAAILERELPAVSSVQPLALPALDRVLRKCLAKAPDARWQSAADLADALRWIADDRTGGTAHGGPAPSAPRRARAAWAPLAIAAAIIVALAVPSTRHLLERSAPAVEMRLDVATPATAQPLHFALSPDGTHLAFVAAGTGSPRLWLRPLNAATAHALPGTEGAEYPFWSPDGRTIGFFATGKVKRIDIAGASPQIIADAPNGRGGTWSRDGVILFAPSNSAAILRVDASGGAATPVTKHNAGEGSHRLPQFLPDGRHFLFFAQGSPEMQGIYLGSLDGGDATRLTASDVAGFYTDPGVVVFMQQNALVARRLDLVHQTLKGEPQTIADGISFEPTFQLGGFSVSAAGTLAYRLGGTERRWQFTWFDRSGRRLGVAGEPDVNAPQAPELSADGRRIANNRTVQNNTDIWLMDVQRGGTTRFTFDAAADMMPVWSPDGERVAFSSNRKGIFNLYLKRSSGAGTDELLVESPYVKSFSDWSRDGRFLLYQNADPKTGWDVAAIPVPGDVSRPIVVANSPFEERGGQFSPDGYWVAYQSNESGRFEIYVQPFPQPSGKWQVSTAGGTDPRWAPEGKELFFVAPDLKMMAVTVRTSGSALEAASPVALFQVRMSVGGLANLKQQYVVARDGRFLINMPTDENELAPITLILNWKPRLTP